MTGFPPATRSAGLRVLVLVLSLPWLTGCGEPPHPVVAGAATGSFLNAVRLAVEDRGEEGGRLLADTVLRVEVSSRSAPALEVAAELAPVPGLVAVVGHSNSVASLATSQVYNQHGIVQIAPTSTAVLYSEAGPFSFRMVPPDDAQGRFLAGVVADSLPAGTRIALLFVNDDYGRGLRSVILERLDPVAHPVVLDLPHTEGDVEPVDVEHAVEAFVASGAQALLWLGRVPALNLVLPPLRDRAGGIPVVGGDAVSRGDLIQEIHPSWDGILFVDFVDMEASPELQDFQLRYRERFGAISSTGAPAGPEVLSYDAAAVILAALREGARTGEEVRDYLMSLGRSRPPHPGLGGPVSFDESGNVDRDYVLRRMRVGAPE
jgi:branched-chain amino acid transport system substrate-binding protein